ncbi:glucosaminidase domain-containing protein [Flavobacterium sp. K5-23]|uniref:glucosaminidase domain-containing protein n=1 Tax=Flavobacterium sp. K5-23 TaxID=2746225 RepID=UPI00200D42A7|nr:glucosaminidase domain-containing protein [Flavobacterium sp. K5-23]UQD54971.1 glucosaminidase domain-containing protein [Flavobacterium sp. K5-23]
MFKKTLLLLILLTLISCNVTKPVIVTTKAAPTKVKKIAVRTSKKKTSTKVIVSQKPTQKSNKREDEVIESTSRTIVGNDIVSNYVYQYKDIAMSNMKSYGIPASIILAQGILESGAGRGDLAKNANNHFGIKCHADWTGESVRHDDDARQECFRKYSESADSFKDHALFLTGRGRYSSLFDLAKDDYQAWAKGLRKAGYATDPRYPEKLISYIERYDLGQYDAQVLGTNYLPLENKAIKVTSVDSYNGSLYEVQKGDTLYSISKKFNVMVDDLKLKNKLTENILSIGQRLIVN